MTVAMVMSPLPESRLIFSQHLRITTGHIGRGRVSWQQLYKAPPGEVACAQLYSHTHQLNCQLRGAISLKVRGMQLGMFKPCTRKAEAADDYDYDHDNRGEYMSKKI